MITLRRITLGLLGLAISSCATDLSGGESEFGEPIAQSTAAVLPSNFSLSQIVSGLVTPTQMAIAPDGRIFALQQTGAIRVIKNNVLLSTPFATLSNVFSTQDYGLLGIAFDPNFATNRFLYVFYAVGGTPSFTRVSRLTANGDVAVAGSELPIFQLDDRPAGNTTHQGGALLFGNDGKLYIFAGTPGDDTSRAQRLTSTCGKVLRINSDGTIPTDNPFFSTTTGRYRAIYALGLRNPFTAVVQPGTGKVYINDNGEATTDEINELARGANYGWPQMEGNVGTPPAGYKAPVYTYQHDATSFSIIGGAFYNPPTAQFPSTYVGKYFFADHVGGWMRYIDPTNTGAGATNFAGVNDLNHPVDMDVAADGSLYVLARGNGTAATSGIYRITYSTTAAPSIAQQPANVTTPVGETAQFCVSAAGQAPLSYQWQRNGTNVSGATATCYTTPAVTSNDNGAVFRVVVRNSVGSVTSAGATLTATSNRRPVARITAPAAGARYSGGDTITYSGSGTDQEDGTLGASALTWWVDFHHNEHTHSTVQPVSGTSGGSFVASRSDEKSTNVWYRIHLRVRDSAGLTGETTVDVLPNKVTLTLQSAPAGLTLNLDGAPVTTPHVFESVVGTIWNVTAPAAGTLGTAKYTFRSWSDGGAASHVITAPVSATTFSATYFQEADIGSVAFAGSGSLSGGVHTIRSSGADIWGNVDAFHYSYVPLAGNGDFKARVTTVQSNNIYAKAGIMIREGLGANARNVLMAIAAGQGATFQRRTTTGGTTTNTVTASLVAPYWVRLARSGDVFTAYRSQNGSSWTQMGQITMPMTGSVYVGLAFTSHDNTVLGTGAFDNVVFP